jgi:uncharacterized protein YcgL (UPF0745 family)
MQHFSLGLDSAVGWNGWFVAWPTQQLKLVLLVRYGGHLCRVEIASSSYVENWKDFYSPITRRTSLLTKRWNRSRKNHTVNTILTKTKPRNLVHKAQTEELVNHYGACSKCCQLSLSEPRRLENSSVEVQTHLLKAFGYYYEDRPHCERWRRWRFHRRQAT